MNCDISSLLFELMLGFAYCYSFFPLFFRFCFVLFCFMSSLSLAGSYSKDEPHFLLESQ